MGVASASRAAGAAGASAKEKATAFLIAVLVAVGCGTADMRPRLGQQVPGFGLIVGHAEIGAARWSVAMRVSGADLCTSWIREREGPIENAPGESCSNEWVRLLSPERAAPVFVHLIGGSGSPESTYLEGIAGIGLARVELDYGAGVIAPPLVDLAPISLRGLGFAFAVPGQIEIRHVRGFDGEGRQILNQTP